MTKFEIDELLTLQLDSALLIVREVALRMRKLGHEYRETIRYGKATPAEIAAFAGRLRSATEELGEAKTKINAIEERLFGRRTQISVSPRTAGKKAKFNAIVKAYSAFSAIKWPVDVFSPEPENWYIDYAKQLEAIVSRLGKLQIPEA